MFDVFFLNFDVWVKDFKVFDVRFAFLVKNCIYFTPGTRPKQAGAKFNNRGGLLTGARGYPDIANEPVRRLPL